jgi:hypothetical protein
MPSICTAKEVIFQEWITSAAVTCIRMFVSTGTTIAASVAIR